MDFSYKSLIHILSILPYEKKKIKLLHEMCHENFNNVIIKYSVRIQSNVSEFCMKEIAIKFLSLFTIMVCDQKLSFPLLLNMFSFCLIFVAQRKQLYISVIIR